MDNRFFERPILNSPYAYLKEHWELDAQGQPTQRIVFDEGLGLSSEAQQYSTSAMINELRREVDAWRALPNPADWRVTPETARLLEYWRHYEFSGVRPFLCQVEAVEIAIWLTEVAPNIGNRGKFSPSTWPLFGRAR